MRHHTAIEGTFSVDLNDSNSEGFIIDELYNAHDNLQTQVRNE